MCGPYIDWDKVAQDAVEGRSAHQALVAKRSGNVSKVPDAPHV